MEVSQWLEPLASVGSPLAVLLLAVLMIFRGYLVPKSYVDELRQEKKEWRELSERQRKMNRILTESLETIVSKYGDAATHFFESIQEEVDKLDEGNEGEES